MGPWHASDSMLRCLVKFHAISISYVLLVFLDFWVCAHLHVTPFQAEMAIMTELLRLIIRHPLPIDVIFNFNGGEEAGLAEC